MNRYVMFAIAILLIVAAAVPGLMGKVSDLKAQVARKDQCEAFVTSHGKMGKPDGCSFLMLEVYHRASESDRCDSALIAGNLSPDCTSPVRLLFGDKTDLQAQLKTTVADQVDSIARAEARGKSQATRKLANDRVLLAAPRAADGSIVCDAQCLRARFEPATAP